MNIIFQQESDEDFQQPWPVVVDEAHTVVSGRPDASVLVGFASPEDPFSLFVMAGDATTTPSLAVGLVPVFEHGGKFFTIDLKVTTCAQYNGDIEALRSYGK